MKEGKLFSVLEVPPWSVNGEGKSVASCAAFLFLSPLSFLTWVSSSVYVKLVVVDVVKGCWRVGAKVPAPAC